MAITRSRFLVLRAAVAAALLVPALAACDFTWTEGICMDDETVIDYPATGGGDCRPQKDSDPDCADGEIPRETRPGREMDCVVNDITKES